MHQVVIRRPELDDEEKLKDFFRMVVSDTFQKEKIADLVEDMEEEIATKMNNLRMDYKSEGLDRFFLLAVKNEHIVGTIEYGPSSSLINELTNDSLEHIVEVGSVLVHPLYQRQGIGNLLFNTMLLALSSRRIEQFCLDSGYNSAQKYWINKLGEPEYRFENYWNEGNDHMIWSKKTSEIPAVFKL